MYVTIHKNLHLYISNISLYIKIYIKIVKNKQKRAKSAVPLVLLQ